MNNKKNRIYCSLLFYQLTEIIKTIMNFIQAEEVSPQGPRKEQDWLFDCLSLPCWSGTIDCRAMAMTRPSRKATGIVGYIPGPKLTLCSYGSSLMPDNTKHSETHSSGISCLSLFHFDMGRQFSFFIET